MNSKLDEKLCKTYPKIFADRYKDKTETCMCWGFECGDGWYDLINETCKKLQVIADTTGVQAIADQVKEKFGTLRFYIHSTYENAKNVTKDQIDTLCDIIFDIEYEADRRSRYICERCGKKEYHSCLRSVGWVYNMCDNCWTKFKEEKGIKEDETNDEDIE